MDQSMTEKPLPLPELHLIYTAACKAAESVSREWRFPERDKEILSLSLHMFFRNGQRIRRKSLTR